MNRELLGSHLKHTKQHSMECNQGVERWSNVAGQVIGSPIAKHTKYGHVISCLRSLK